MRISNDIQTSHVTYAEKKITILMTNRVHKPPHQTSTPRHEKMNDISSINLYDVRANLPIEK